jgi:hypothetical protein
MSSRLVGSFIFGALIKHIRHMCELKIEVLGSVLATRSSLNLYGPVAVSDRVAGPGVQKWAFIFAFGIVLGFAILSLC